MITWQTVAGISSILGIIGLIIYAMFKSQENAINKENISLKILKELKKVDIPIAHFQELPKNQRKEYLENSTKLPQSVIDKLLIPQQNKRSKIAFVFMILMFILALISIGGWFLTKNPNIGENNKNTNKEILIGDYLTIECWAKNGTITETVGTLTLYTYAGNNGQDSIIGQSQNYKYEISSLRGVYDKNNKTITGNWTNKTSENEGTFKFELTTNGFTGNYNDIYCWKGQKYRQGYNKTLIIQAYDNKGELSIRNKILSQKDYNLLKLDNSETLKLNKETLLGKITNEDSLYLISSNKNNYQVYCKVNNFLIKGYIANKFAGINTLK